MTGMGADVEHLSPEWVSQLVEQVRRHGPDRIDGRRCRRCGARYACAYRLDALTELREHGDGATIWATRFER